MSRVEVFQEGDGRWRWEYRDEKIGLKSNRTYTDEDAARRAAEMAYPDHFKRSSPSAQASRDFVHKLAAVLTVFLTIVAWRRRAAGSS